MPLTIRSNRRLAWGLAAALLACLWLAARADAAPHVYWAHFNGSTLESIPADGSEPAQVLISGASNPVGVAVDSRYVYWANFGTEDIGRAKLDGSQVEQAFINGANAYALAVAGNHIYWTDADTGSIGRARLDGSQAEPTFIADVGAFYGLAADEEHLYWGNDDDHSIARANLDGTEVEREFVDPAGPLTPYGVAVDSDHIYWANSQNDSVGRASLAGGEVIESFIPGAHPAGVAVDSGHVYWGYATFGGGLGRANLDGSDADNDWIPAGGTDAFGIAATPPDPSLTTAAAPDVTLGTAIRGRAILSRAYLPTGTIALELFGPGDPNCTGAPIATESVSVEGNGAYPSAPIVPAAAGTYHWRADYSGDAENDPLQSGCGGAVRVVDPRSPPPPTPAGPCAPVVSSAASFVPTPKPGRLVPGVRALIKVNRAARLQVTASLTYRLGGKTRRLDLGSHAVHASSRVKLRLPLPAGSRPPLGTRVKVKLWIATTPDDAPGCTPGASTLSSFRTKVVRVLPRG